MQPARNQGRAEADRLLEQRRRRARAGTFIAATPLMGAMHDQLAQVKRVSDALADSVVDLIKDANGNHVRRGYRLDLIALLSRSPEKFLQVITVCPTHFYSPTNCLETAAAH